MFRNVEQILNNAASDHLKALRRDVLSILSAALYAVDPAEAVRRNLRLENGVLSCGGKGYDFGQISRIFVVGAGKAGGAMAEAVESVLGDRITQGYVNVLQGTEGPSKLEKITLNGARHPLPDEKGVEGTRSMLDLLRASREDDLVIVLLSGGGSALMTSPADGVRLEDLQEVTDRLLRSGARIGELNAVRKHLSAIKGGQLAEAASPSAVLSLILSDVVGDPLDTIASGPTSPDRSTFQEALEVLQRRDLWEEAPVSVRDRIERGVRGEVEETPKGDEVFLRRVHNVVIGNNLLAAENAHRKARELGYNSKILTTAMEGEAREVGQSLSEVAREEVANPRDERLPSAIIVGGETTVTVTGGGKGGRNQELALSASVLLEGLDIVLASLATDGIDGPTDAAGAIVDGMTVRRAASKGLRAEQCLAVNDSYGFFSELGDLLLTGPTGTNVNDLVIILVSGLVSPTDFP
ncbi:MAG TPA: DUF4147 domain-containing protein [Patescibacteria group bacterium]|nr:DUF4147 domain-containing protein [Patescibacteria group bacterium]